MFASAVAGMAIRRQVSVPIDPERRLLGGLDLSGRLGNQFLGERDDAIFDAGLEWT